MGDVTAYAWSYENQLAQLKKPDDTVTTYQYAPVTRNSDELRLSKETDLGTTNFIWDQENIIRELDDTGLVEAEYTLNPQPYGHLVSQHRSAESSFYNFDALGSTESLTDSSATQTDGYIYTAFGEIAEQTGTTENNYTWVGKLGYYREDDRYFTGERIYQAPLGQYMSKDPAGFVSGKSDLYQYSSNNPINRTDPSGLDDTARIHTDNDQVTITDATNTGINGYVANIVQKNPNIAIRTFTTSAPGELWKGDSYCVSISRIIIAVRSDEVTHWTQWDDWFKKNGTLCNAYTGEPLNPPAPPRPQPPAPPSNPPTCRRPPSYEPGFGEYGPGYFPGFNPECIGGGLSQCDTRQYISDEDREWFSTVIGQLEAGGQIAGALALGDIADAFEAWNGVGAFTGKDLSTLEWSVGLLLAVIPLVNSAAARQALKRLLAILEGILDRVKRCAANSATVRKLEELIESVKRKLGEFLRDERGSIPLPGGGFPPDSPLQQAIDRGMRYFRGKDAPDRLVDVLKCMGRPMSRTEIGDAIHRAKKAMGMGAADDIIFDYSGGLWDSRNGEFIGKIWEFI